MKRLSAQCACTAARVQPAAPPGFRMTGVVSKMVFVSQMLTKAETARTAANQLLSGVQGADSLVAQCEVRFNSILIRF